jgi:uncharacterized protein (UPF0548 family)
MKLVLNARSSPAAACERWQTADATSPPTGPDRATLDHYRAPVEVGPNGNALAAFERVRERLLAYDIFPPWLMRHASCPAGRLAEGTTIVQRVLVGPLALEMAVRVLAVWDRSDGVAREAGLSYVTLAGHAERGVVVFRVRLEADRRVVILIDARSRPGLLLTRLGRPFARLFQRAATRAALRRLASAG